VSTEKFVVEVATGMSPLFEGRAEWRLNRRMNWRERNFKGISSDSGSVWEINELCVGSNKN
jgi:hypothetical protein